MAPTDQALAIEAVYAAGHWLLQNDRPREAVDVFRTIMLAAPTDERGWLGLAAAHDALGEHTKALELLRLAPDATGPRARLALCLARALRHVGEDATDAYELAADLAFSEDAHELLTIVQTEKVQS